MKKFRKFLSIFFYLVFAVFVANVILLVGFKIDFVVFTFSTLAWFEPANHQWVAYLILIGGILSLAFAILLQPVEEDPTLEAG
ncbi:MAG: hypothetical protein WC467_03820 [Patescibacteria group bacterium]